MDWSLSVELDVELKGATQCSDSDIDISDRHSIYDIFAELHVALGGGARDGELGVLILEEFFKDLHLRLQFLRVLMLGLVRRGV